MKKLILFSLLVLFPLTASAHEIFAVEKPDGSVVIVNYFAGTDTLEEVINDLGLTGYPIQRITKEDLPDSREDRDIWTFNDVPIGKRIKVDETKKADKEAEKAAKELAKNDLLVKLKITEDEAKLLKEFK